MSSSQSSEMDQISGSAYGFSRAEVDRAFDRHEIISGHNKSGPAARQRSGPGTEEVTSMQAQRTVKLYVGNRVDGEVDLDPDTLAAEFVKAAFDGFELPQRGSLEFAYRWWLADPKGRNSTWDESDWDALVEALGNHLGALGQPTKDLLWKRVGG